MDVALILNDSEHSDHDAVVGIVKRARPQKATKASLLAQIEAFEFVVKYLPYVLEDMYGPSLLTSTPADSEEAHATTAEERDAAQRMRDFLRRTILLSKEAENEIVKRTEYLRMLKHHYEGVANLRRLLRGVRLDDWHWMCERWRALTLAYYKPLSGRRCYAIAKEMLQTAKAHELPEGTKLTGAFGWQDWVQLDEGGHYVRFMTTKTMMNVGMEQLVDFAWAIYSDANLFKKYHFGDKCDLFLQVVQRISPDMMVVQTVERYPDLVQLTHSLSLVFRVRTETGYTIAVRNIGSPDLLSLMKAEGLSLGGNCFWETFEVASRNAQGECDGVRYVVTGSVGSDNPTYAKRARNEILIALVRSEVERTGVSLVSIESSPDEEEKASVPTSGTQATA